MKYVSSLLNKRHFASSLLLNSVFWSLIFLWRNRILDRWCVPPLQWTLVELLEPISIMCLLLCLALYKYERRILIQRRASNIVFTLACNEDVEIWYWFFHSPNRSPFLNHQTYVLLEPACPWKYLGLSIRLIIHLCCL